MGEALFADLEGNNFFAVVDLPGGGGGWGKGRVGIRVVIAGFFFGDGESVGVFGERVGVDGCLGDEAVG